MIDLKYTPVNFENDEDFYYAEKQRLSEVGTDGSSNNDNIDDDFDKRDIEKK